MLIEKGLDVNVNDRRNMTALHYIAYYDFSRRGQDDWTEDDTFGQSESISNPSTADEMS